MTFEDLANTLEPCLMVEISIKNGRGYRDYCKSPLCGYWDNKRHKLVFSHTVAHVFPCQFYDPDCCGCMRDGLQVWLDP